MDPTDDVESATLCGCGGGKKCPKISEKADGSFALSDPDAGLAPIPLDREQARALVDWLGGRLREPQTAE